MAENTSVNLDITNNADGFDITGGTTGRKLTVTGADITATGSGSNTYTFPTSTSTLASLTLTETLTNKTLTAPKIADLGFIADANGNEQIIMDTVTSAVNEVTLANAATGNAPKLSTTGGDTNINFHLGSKGTGVVYGPLALPQGHMINGKISASVATSDLTFALKTLDDEDPSADNPIYIRIGNSIRAVTAATTKTLNDATNWFNAGAVETATYAIDYFVYAVWNTTPGTDRVDIILSRYPYFRTYSEFSGTSTNEKYGAFSGADTPTSTDEVEVIGRLTATLSAGAAYTWSISGTGNVINRPIYNTDILTWDYQLTYTGGGGSNLTPTRNAKRYSITNNQMFLSIDASMNAAFSAGTGNAQITIPLSANTVGVFANPIFVQDASDSFRNFPGVFQSTATANLFSFAFFSQDAGGTPPTLAASDRAIMTINVYI
jgi:hypothetical protein